MASGKEWYNDQLSKLVYDDLRIPTLREIKDHLLSITHEDTTYTFELSSIFDCLNDSNSEQVDLACEILSLCIPHLDLLEILHGYHSALERALNHSHPTVKTMALGVLEQTLGNSELIRDVCRSKMLGSIVRCIGDDDLYVVKKASQVVGELGKTTYGLEQLLQQELLVVLNEVMSESKVKQMRINEVFINIAKKDEHSLKMLEMAGMFSSILKDLDNNDILYKLNIIEILSYLVTTKHGYDYLSAQGTIKKIFDITENDSDPIAIQLCEPGVIKFFGHIAYWKPSEIFNKYPTVVKKVFSYVDSDDLTLVGVSLDTLGHIAETDEGKFALESTGDSIINVLKVVPQRIASLPTELRIRALACLENILRIEEIEGSVTSIVHKWYSALGDDPMQMIFKVIQNPFSEIRLAGLGVVNAIATYVWGQECFRNTPGFVEFLLDRRSETFKDCKRAKFDIIKKLSSSMVFDHNTQLRFQEFVKEGPFYVQAVTEVAIEGQE